jgi:hypothetical protein
MGWYSLVFDLSNCLLLPGDVKNGMVFIGVLFVELLAAFRKCKRKEYVL